MARDAFRVESHDEGRRLDRILRLRWPEIPLGTLARALRTGEVRVDGKKRAGGDPVIAGETITAPWPPPGPYPEREGKALPLEILWEAPELWVVNKPAGLLTQPGRDAPDSVAARAWAREKGGGAFRPTPVHRLDRNTSGVLLVARSGVGLRALQEAWRLGRVEKTYWAVLWTGDEKIPEGATVDFPLRKDPSTNTVTVAPDGAFSRTIFRTLIRRPPLALVALDLETGRPHQARVHAAAWGYPVWGDRKYGVITPLSGTGAPPRPLLHARELGLPSLPAPLEGLSERTFVAPVPEDFVHFFGTLDDAPRRVAKYTQ